MRYENQLEMKFSYLTRLNINKVNLLILILHAIVICIGCTTLVSNKLLYSHDRITLQYCKSMHMTIKIIRTNGTNNNLEKFSYIINHESRIFIHEETNFITNLFT